MSKKSSSSNSSFSAGTANAPVAGLHAAFSQYLTIAAQTSSPVHCVCAVEAFLANLLRNWIFKLPMRRRCFLELHLALVLDLAPAQALLLVLD
jgi:hypothetical protein